MDPNSIIMVLNDMSTPDLVKVVPVPAAPSPSIAVEEYFGGGFALDTPEGRAAHCYAVAAQGINLATKYHKIPLKWAATQVLNVKPEAGVFFNSYYDRLALRYYHAYDPIRQKEMYCSWSMDIVAHELGHAVLDAIRPDLYNFAVFEIMSLHESWGDFFAICNGLQHEEVLNNLYKETKGDLRVPNSVSRIAEEFGMAYFKTPLGSIDCLRSALNSFQYVAPTSLPPAGTATRDLVDEPHSFSQIMTGALYEILMLIFEDIHNSFNGNRMLAFKLAVDTMLKYTFGSMLVAPANPLFFSAFAVGMVYTDITYNNSKYRSILEKVFITERKIIQVPASNPTLLKVSHSVSPTRDKGTPYEVSHKRREFIRISDEVGHTANPLYQFNVETPFDSHYSLNKDGTVQTLSQANRQDGVKSVQASLDYLHRRDLVGDGEHQTFKVVDGNIQRKQFACFPRS